MEGLSYIGGGGGPHNQTWKVFQNKLQNSADQFLNLLAFLSFKTS